jgi:hypothetical protein
VNYWNWRSKPTAALTDGIPYTVAADLSIGDFLWNLKVALSTLQYWRREARQSGRGRREGALVEVPANAAGTESLGRAAPPLPGRQ